MTSADIIILGAGAAGLMCAMTAGQRKKRVIVLERANKVGKKILMSGGGRCNFTNRIVTPNNYLSDNPAFCTSALQAYPPEAFIALVEQYGIRYHEKKHGQLFCDGPASDIVAMLLQECKKARVEIITECDTRQVSGAFELCTTQGDFTANALVVATGGLSIPTLGGSDYGYKLAKQYGLSVLPPRAGLVPFVFTDAFKPVLQQLSGIALPVCASTGKTAFTEDLLFTHRGLSGPAILQLSNYWQPQTSININLLPAQDAYNFLKQAKDKEGKAQLRHVLQRVLPKALVVALEALWWDAVAHTPLAELSDKTLALIAKNLAAWTLKPAGTEGYRTAEVTLGGVNTAGLSSKTLSAHTCKNLYFIGEVVDVTGELGGFNFQWAWASGAAAGRSC